MNEQNGSVQMASESWTAEEVLTWAYREFGHEVAISSAFGAEGMVLIDIAARVRRNFRVFTIDTEFLFPETYSLMDHVEQRYGIKIEKVYPLLSPEQQEKVHGAGLWSRNPDRCCEIRKVEPLRRKLAEMRAWITGIRREQTTSRAEARKAGWDEKFGLIKINPIADWSSQQVWRYIHDHDVPYNPLHDRGYPSIGCWPCTRPVGAGEDERAGRWAGRVKKECGLHVLEHQGGSGI